MADELALLKDEIGDLVKQLQHEAQVAILEELRDMLEKEIDEGDLVRTDPTPAPRAKPKRRRAPSHKANVNGRARDDLKDDEFIGAVGAGLVCGIDGCDFVGKTQGGLRNHQVRKHDLSKALDDRAERVRTEEDEGAIHACGIDGCSFVGRTTQGLSTHRARKHKGTGDFPCSVEGCDHVSQTKSGLQVHDRRKHRGGGGTKPTLGLELCDTGESGACDKAADGDDGCDGGVSEWTCEYERTADCKHTVRRCQAHGGDRSCKMSLGHHHRKHDQAGHDAPIDFSASS